jgi:polysaccharide biosynthesis transport protein
VRCTIVDSSAQKETSFSEIVSILRRRRVTILVTVLIVAIAGVALAFRPRKFAADGTIRIQPGNASMYRATTAVVSGVAADKISSEVVILQSRSLYLQVAKELNLANEPPLWGKHNLKLRSLDDPEVRQRLFVLMTDAIKVDHTPKDEIITITCTTQSAPLSARIVNTLINDYVSYLFKMRYGSTQRATLWLVGQLDDLKAQIEHDQASIISLQGKLGVIGFDPLTSDYLAASSLDSYTKAASAATIERVVAEAKYRILRDSDPNLIEGEVSLLPQGGSPNPANSLLDNLRNSRAVVAGTYANLSARFGDNYPDVKQVKAQLDQLDREVQTEQGRIINQAKLAYQAASTNETKTNAEAQKKKGQVFGSHDNMLQYMTLMNDYQSHRTLYGGLIQRLREAGITSGLEAGEIDIVDLADLPALPVPPGPLLLLVGSVLGGVIVGCLVALGIEALDTRIATQEQAEQATGLPVLAVTPHLRLGKRSENDDFLPIPVAISAPRSHFAESVQSLRTALLFARPGSISRIIMVTSAAPLEGKSLIAINLATVFAQHRARVLLIDCNLRRGVIGPSFGQVQKGGLTNILSGQMPYEDVLHRVPGIEGLWVLPSGPQIANPSVLLGSSQMRQLVEDCRAKFDFVILDAPPVLGIADTLNLGVVAEAVVLVIRSSVSTKTAGARMAKLLEASHMPVIGVLLNDSRLTEQEQGYRKYKSYYEDQPEDTR